MKKKLLATAIISSIFVPSISFGEKISAEFNNAKLSTVVDAISQASNFNVIWDKDAIAQKDKLVNLSIKRPIEAESLFNLVLLENGLISIKENGIYKIKVADDYSITIPSEVIKAFGKDLFDGVISNVKRYASPSAVIKVDNLSYTIFVKDDKDNIDRIKVSITAYIDSVKKQSEEISKLQQQEGQFMKKEFNIDFEKFKSIEDNIAENIGLYGKYEYDKEKEKLVVFDTKENVIKISRLVGQITQDKIETKCFYARGLEPGEIIENIKENDLSENGTVIFKAKGVSETRGVEQRQISTTGTAQLTGVTAGITEPTSQTAGIITSLPKICITDTAKVIEKIKYKYSDYLLDRPYQIAIEARIVQISTKNLKDLGIQWGGGAFNLDNNRTKIISGSNTNNFTYAINYTSPTLSITRNYNGGFAADFPASNAKIGSGFALGFILGGTQNFLDIRLSALQSIGKSRILSKPQIVTIDGEMAEISQGYEVPYTTAVAAGGGTTASVSFKKAVLKLNVTPRTTADGNIIMDLIITQDIPDFKNTVLGNPPIQTKTITSKVVAKDGSTVVIGGILEKTEDQQRNGIPGLMNVPILGALFREDINEEQATELLIFLSPKIVYE